MHPLTPTILKPIAGHPVQAYLDNRLQLYDVLEFILEYTGPADILVSTFSTGEEFLRRLYRLRESGRVTHATLIADLKAASKTVQLWQFMRSVFSEVFLTENHSKVLLVAGSRRRVAVVTSQNQTRGNRHESAVICAVPDVFDTLYTQCTDIMSNQAIRIDELLHRTAGSDQGSGS